MMNYAYSYGASMMGGLGYIGFVTWMVLIVDGVLLGIWLWQKIQK